MSFYSERILPHLINFACSTKPNQKQREKIVPQAEGDVLEIGFGSGLNLPYYDSTKVRRIWGLEPSEGMRRKAEPLVEASGLEVDVRAAHLAEFHRQVHLARRGLRGCDLADLDRSPRPRDDRVADSIAHVPSRSGERVHSSRRSSTYS